MHTSAEPAVSIPHECAAASAAGTVQKKGQQKGAAAPAQTRRDLARPRGAEIKTFVLLSTMMFFCTAGNALLDKTMKGVGEINLSSSAAILDAAARTFGSGTIWVGLVCLTIFMATQMMALSMADYSFVIPFSALSYALVPLVGYLWLGEAVAAARWVGIALIVCGVVLVSRTSPNTTGPNTTGPGAAGSANPAGSPGPSGRGGAR